MAKEEKPVVEVKPQVSPQTGEMSVIVSNEDAHLHQRIKSQPKSLEELEIQFEVKPKEGKHRLSLPDELVPYESKYAFRWLFKRKRSIDEACDVIGWKIITRNYFPELPTHLFSVSGAIERGDSILAFMPIKRRDEIRSTNQMKAKVLREATIGRHKGNPNFYTPQDEEGGRVVGL